MQCVFGAVLHGDVGPLAEGHIPVAVEPAAGVHADRQRIDLAEGLPTHTEKVAYRAFHGGIFLVIPVYAQDAVAPMTGSGTGEPDVVDHAHTANICQYQRAARFGDEEGIHLPTSA